MVTEPRRSAVGARLIAAVSAVVWGLLFFGVIDLLVAVEHTPGFYESYLLETGWGLLYTFLVALNRACERGNGGQFLEDRARLAGAIAQAERAAFPNGRADSLDPSTDSSAN